MRTTLSSLPRRLRTIALAALAALPLGSVQAQSAPAPRPTFLYLLRLAPAYQQQEGWTAQANALVGAHFQRLKAATEAGQVLLAGRTSEALDKTFGLVIFEAADEAAARQFMETDPAVAGGVMLATLHPYSVALLRGSVR